MDPHIQRLQDIAATIREQVTGPHDFVQTSPCGGGQRHPHGLVGYLFRVEEPEKIRVGHCFFAGRLKKGDLLLCTEHSGDCFQTYIFIEEYGNCLVGLPKFTFGSYGMGGAQQLGAVPKTPLLLFLAGGVSVHFEGAIGADSAAATVSKVILEPAGQ